MARPTRPLALLLAAAVGVGSVVAMPQSSAQGTEVSAGPAGTDPVDAAWRAAGCGHASGVSVPDGTLPVVSMPPAPTWRIGAMTRAHWSDPPVTDPTWRLWFYSLRWTRPIAKQAYDDGQTRTLAKVVSQVESFYRLHPDPGTSTKGWDEGTSLRRLETLNCLYILTGDKRLANRMSSEVAVQFSPRYYGPPYAPVHNHGLMANLRVKHAGQLIGRRDWVDAARARIGSESRLAFSARGTSLEQSSGYHLINRQMWLGAARRLEELDPKDAVAKDIRARMARAEEVGRWITAPDGDIAQFGDSQRTRGITPKGNERLRAMRDDEAGLIAGRWSWTDAKTSHYTLRYGPARWAHGHHDKGAVTWSTAGARVLVGPGYFSYDWSDPYAARARSVQAQNASWPVRGRLNPRAGAVARSGGHSGTTHAWRVHDRVFGMQRSREVRIDDRARTLATTDTYPRGTEFRQSWHLDPAWQLVNQRGKTLNFAHPDGQRLQVSTTGRYVSTLKGRTNPPAGWNHPRPGSRVANYEITIGGTTTATTTFRVH